MPQYNALADQPANRMAYPDTMRATPRNEYLGALADLLAQSYAPQRTQQMQGVAQFLSLPAISNTLNMMAYGDPLTTGAGMTTKVKPDVLEAGMAVAPAAKPVTMATLQASREARRAALTGRVLPIGLSTEVVGGMGFLRPSVAPQEEALRLAQQRAALPPSQGGLGLPPNNTATDRAKAMGFDTETLHGTAKNFTSFDLSKAGTNTRQAGDELGIFSTSKPFLADDYAQIASKGGWAGRTEPENAVVYPLVGSFKNPKKYQTASEFYRDADAMATEQKLGQWREQLQKEGYDSVFVRPDLEEVVAFNPSQLRSRFAAFDPWRKTAATAAAFGVAAPDLLASESNDDINQMRKLKANKK